MIQVAAKTAVAIRQPRVATKLRFRWHIGANDEVMDITRRVITVPTVSRSISALLSGGRVSGMKLSLVNTDNLLSPDSGYMASKTAQTVMLSKVTMEQGIQAADETWEYVPIYTGLVREIDYLPGRAELALVDPLSAAGNRALPETITLGVPGSDYEWPSDAIQQLYTDHAPFVTFDSGSFDHADGIHKDTGWSIMGEIKEGTKLAGAVNAIAASGLGQVIAQEDGTVSFVTEFPRVAGNRIRIADEFPDKFDSSRAAGWRMKRGLPLSATELRVAYQGTSVGYRDTTKEGDIGREAKTVPCPYIRFGRSAFLAARILYESIQNLPMEINFLVGARGLLVQLGDRVRVHDPISDTARTVRVVAKRWHPKGVKLATVVDGHEDTIIKGEFASWDSTTWGDADEVLL